MSQQRVVHRLPADEEVVSPASITRFRVLGLGIDGIQIPDVVAQMERWISKRRVCHYVAVTGMHGVTIAQKDVGFKQILNSASLVVPDGMPLVWLGRHVGLPLKRRVYGPELMATFCRETGARYRHFFYGGAAMVAERLAELMQKSCGIQVAGTYSPPFRPLTEEEDSAVIALINAASPDVLWVGLSTPKQERWMYEHRNRVRVPVMLGVGAAFDLNTGRVRQAPGWVRENGLEWLFRLLAEPRRLWRRYLLCGSSFVWNVGLEIMHLKNFDR
jgi:N-acetylglucosaminyldiphosphoundecaprenol N-acetyl-beta-D-mannosaminyltransferase